MKFWPAIFALLLAAGGVGEACADPAAGLSAVEVFALADAAKADRRFEDALQLYSALGHDPDSEVRAEARFRRGMLLSDLRRYAEAAVAFRALLDEKPEAARVRLELARVLAQEGDEAGARRALRQAQAAGLPEDVTLAIDRFAQALRSTRPFGGSIQVSLAPDTNINRATSSRTLDTVIAPITLDEDARARSGLGIRLAGQAFLRIPVGSTLTFLPRVSVSGQLYRESEFNDLSGSSLVGLEWRTGKDRLTPSIGLTWRWFGNRLYARSRVAAVDWLHPIGKRSQVTLSGSTSRVRFANNTLQDGTIYDASATFERALSQRTGVGGSLGATRQTARDPGYATWSGQAGLFGYHEIGRTTMFATAGLRRTEGDARLFLFPERRREWLLQLGAGATLRALAFRGFAPLLRVGYERNASTVGLYDYRKLSAEVGITRAF